MNNEEINKELEPRQTDKEQQAHSNQGTTNEKKQPTDQNVSELVTQQIRESSRKLWRHFNKQTKKNILSLSQKFIGSYKKVNLQQKEILNEKDHPIITIQKIRINNHQRQTIRSHYNQQTKKMILTKKTVQLIHNRKK